MSAAEKIDLSPDLDQARELFAELDQVHLVAIDPDSSFISGRLFGDDAEAAAQWAQRENIAGRNIYWSVNRVRSGTNKKPSKRDIEAARFAHVDLDPPKDSSEWDRDGALARLRGHSQPPSFVIDSGNGWQAFWRLSEPVETWSHVETVNDQLRHHFGGDNCHNIDRLMRVPGFRNFPNAKKRAGGRDTQLASWADNDDGVVYEVEELAGGLPPVPSAPKQERTAANDQAGASNLLTANDLDLGPLDQLRSAIEHPLGQDRSGDMVAVARLMANRGFRDEQIMGILLNRCNAVSAHAFEQRDPRRAVVRAIEFVRRTAGSSHVESTLRERSRGNGIKLADFHAYLPAHSYIFAPTGELWPAASVNANIAQIPVVNRRGEPLFDKKGEPVMQNANSWLDQYRSVAQMTWAPGEPQVIADKLLIREGGWITHPGCSTFNLYRPPLSIRGDASQAGRWIDHVRRVYPDEAEHIIHWLAHRVQRPQEKINHAIVMGGDQGIGKDTILEPVKAAVGPWNVAEVSPQQMLGRFNGFLKSVILRVSEARDLGDVDRFAFYDHTKSYITSPPDVHRVDEKHLREYAVLNVTGVIITTNHKSDGIYLPADDRRHFVAWSNLTRDDFEPEYWTERWAWYRAGGLGHVAAYLASLPLEAFDPKAPPRKTRAFWDIVDANQAPEDAELADAIDRLNRPPAVTVRMVEQTASEELRNWLLDRRNNRRLPHRFEECGYVRVRNPNAKDGHFVVNGSRGVIYARKELAQRDAITAADRLAGNR